MKIAVDAMGGDHAPEEIVKGALEAAKKFPCEIVLVGDQKQIEQFIDQPSEKISIRHAPEVIEMGEHPSEAVRTKKNSSIVVATELVKSGECDAVLSAGNTGAAAAAAQLILRRIRGVGRPAIATPLPTPRGVTLMLDSGANVDSKPEHLAQIGVMAAVYVEHVFGKSNPTVGLLNIGEEASKGNEQVKAAYQILNGMTEINFVGNVEGRDIPVGKVDVVICDGFVGNVVLKFAEGLAMMIMGLIRDAIVEGGVTAKLGAVLLTPTLKQLGKRLDASEYGGAPLLGVNGCCVISHGSSNAKAICSAIGAANDYVGSNVLGHITTALEKQSIDNSWL
ncbi:MAG: phosphate acyltransferase PlsX [Selenomonadaceae bacterium]|nr:phosphate acyltransferase PlsX [Selenomonadaceae bacterium]MBR1579134.1 phosphate acyltransferase PlsX [Selenomonadaceae bacterium]